MERGRSSFSRALHQNIWDKVDFIHQLFWKKSAEASYFSFLDDLPIERNLRKLLSLLDSQ